MFTKEMRELERQSLVLEQDENKKRFYQLWEEFKKEQSNPTNEQFIAFEWLFKALVSEKEKFINRHIL